MASARKRTKFLVIGSGGGGATIAWLLAKAGQEVTLLEQGQDLLPKLDLPDPRRSPAGFNSIVHDEATFRLRRPDPKRRPRGDYNTFRANENSPAKPFKNGWTGSVLGGGSVIWGTWSFRATPIDFKLNTHFAAEGQLHNLAECGYSIIDWPVEYKSFMPYYEIAEALFSVNGSRPALNDSIEQSSWYKAFVGRDYWGPKEQWFPSSSFAGPPYPRNPVGQFVFDAMEGAGMRAFTLPLSIVSPDTPEYRTRDQLGKRLAAWTGADKPEFWKQPTEQLWSDAVRDACNQCGFCGEYLCWGKRGPKSGTHVTTLKEMQQMQSSGNKDVEVVTGARVFELLYDDAAQRVTSASYLDISDPDRVELRSIEAEYVIVSGGAVQSARLLHSSKGRKRKGELASHALGNSSNQLGRNVSFHMFGFAVQCTFAKDFQELLRGEFGPTGNTASFWPYFLRNPADGRWIKTGILTSTARKNPLDDAVVAVERDSKLSGRELIKRMEEHPRTLQIRCTSDDLPMRRNRVDLDENYVDEYGFPVARITRALGPNEELMQTLMEKEFERILAPYEKSGALQQKSKFSPAAVDLIGDHQMGTCRMGSNSDTSVVDRMCRMWDAPNVFVVDSSFMPSGLGLNPMMTVVANALRVGSWIVGQLNLSRDPATVALD